MIRGTGRIDRRSLRGALALAAGVCALGGVVIAGAGGAAPPGANDAHPQKRELPPVRLAPAPATGAFGLDLLREGPVGNTVLSPDSVAAALAMAGAGATGRTASQIARTLHLKGPGAFGAVGNLQRIIAREQASAGEGETEPPTLSLANGLFVQQGFPLRPGYIAGLDRHFSATPESVDFKGNPAKAVERVNGWASDHTDGLIPELFASLSPWTRLVLTNAVYLDADWRHPFKARSTSRASFHNREGSTSTEFMHQTERLRYGAGPGYRAVELPYSSSTLSLLVVLPEGQGVAALQERLGPRGIAKAAHRLSPMLVELSLPRFHLRTKITLNGRLKALGMTVPFSDSAGFGRITAAERLKISEVAHAVDFKVDEAGTVAAAATGVGFVAVSRPRTVPFNANHPFLFFLRERKTGAVLFAGRLTDPTSPAR